MATEESDVRYKAIAGQCDEIRAELADTEKLLDEAKQGKRRKGAIDEEVDAALSLVDDLNRVTEDRGAHAESVPANALGVRIGLTFGPTVKGEKRVIQRLLGGIVAFGNTPLPVPLVGANRDLPPSVDTTEKPAASGRGRTGTAQSTLGDGGPLLSGMNYSHHPEGISLTMVNRGDRI